MNSAHDLDTWRLFFQVVNLGSVSKAAQSLHQETSAISRKLNKLEKDLGTELFTKDGRKLKLTSAGFVAFSRMRRIVLDAGCLINDLSQGQENLEQLITIAAPIGISEKLLPICLLEYMKIEPSTRFSCRSMSYVELFSTETFQGYDIILSTSPITTATNTTMLLGGIKHIMTASTEFLRGENVSIKRPEDLNNYPLFSFYSRNRERNTHLKKGSETYHLNLDACCRFNHPGAIKTAVLDNYGVGVYCPYYFYASEIKNGQVQQVLPDWTMPLQQVYLNKKHTQRDYVNDFINWFFQRFINFEGIISPMSNGFWMSDFSANLVHL